MRGPLQNSNKMKALKCPLDLLSWMSLKASVKALSAQCWKQTPDKKESTGEEGAAAVIVISPGDTWLWKRRGGVV